VLLCALSANGAPHYGSPPCNSPSAMYEGNCSATPTSSTFFGEEDMMQGAKRSGKLLAAELNRREFARLAALLAAGSALPFTNELALAQDIKAIASIPADCIRLHTNENPMGPCPAALEAIRQFLPQGGQYLFGQTTAFVEAMAADVGLPTS